MTPTPTDLIPVTVHVDIAGHLSIEFPDGRELDLPPGVELYADPHDFD